MTREARPYMKPGSSIMTMTYYAAEKGVAKAALEATTRYLAADLGPSGIRVNAISARPVRTLSAHGIAGFRTMYGACKDVDAAAVPHQHRGRRRHRGIPGQSAFPSDDGRGDLRGRRLQHPCAAGGGRIGRVDKGSGPLTRAVVAADRAASIPRVGLDSGCLLHFDELG